MITHDEAKQAFVNRIQAAVAQFRREMDSEHVSFLLETPVVQAEPDGSVIVRLFEAVPLDIPETLARKAPREAKKIE